ncbi:GNAT family N-acetyltransferase [Pseudalkalibacillus hwajinpoensis]|uniref:GNAT family N-acetyltransferase n=1 Tax=Guptibacillus hwajinpoensis TaxID=208199 RepID=A0A4U1MMB3_9BACL|nr:GNAT family N-acetyltransferase [Pseudalkalibacillus hwajinpoensis]TKD71851.1 GNAT family N-acetyltransferase [Pseudalkalibacillus hwajinpoensis]
MVIKVVESKSELDDAFKVRYTVFVEEQKVPAELEIDENEKDAIHFVAYDEHTPVAAGRFRVLDQKAKVERICVLSSYRKTGLGQELMITIEKHAKKLELTKTKLNAQLTAVGFYKKLGYETVSEEFMDAGIPHVTMIKEL